MNFTPEQIAKAKAAKTAEELLALAKENGMELSEEEAKNLFAKLHAEGELADEELSNVSGGGCQSNVYISDTDHSFCHNYVHWSNGETFYERGSRYCKCGTCKYLDSETGKGPYCNDYDTTKYIIAK